MATATTTAVVFGLEDGVEQVVALLEQGAVTLEQVVEQLTTVAYPLQDVCTHAMGRLDAATMAAVLQAQQALAVAAATKAAAKGGSGRERARIGDLSLSVAKRGGCSVYGLKRFPVTEYQSTWERMGQTLFGLTAEQVAKSPIGRWFASQPTESYTRADYCEGKASSDDKAWYAAASKGEHPHATVKAGVVVVSLAAKPAKA